MLLIVLAIYYVMLFDACCVQLLTKWEILNFDKDRALQKQANLRRTAIIRQILNRGNRTLISHPNSYTNRLQIIMAHQMFQQQASPNVNPQQAPL